jgi:TetR/AcrR family transcriptional regulator, transcriptional repressor for nem operon
MAMPRTKSYNPEQLVDAALRQFWKFGYSATSMDDLVRVTGVNRHGIYAEFDGKRGLFLACLARYRASVVDPAFACVERPGATIRDIEKYFEYQIANAERAGLPGPGCLMANTATENAPHDARIKSLVVLHNQRLEAGFSNALLQSAQAGKRSDKLKADKLAVSLVAFANGLWTLSRLTADASRLRTAARTFVDLLKEEFVNVRT